MDNKPKGGRGCQAPYKTIVVRIPEALKSKVESIAFAYRDMVSNTELTQDDLSRICPDVFDYPLKTKIEAIQVAKKILKSKKSSRYSIQRLLRELYEDKNINL